MTSGANSANKTRPGDTDPAASSNPTALEVRRARTSDVLEIKRLIDVYAGRILLEKNLAESSDVERSTCSGKIWVRFALSQWIRAPKETVPDTWWCPH